MTANSFYNAVHSLWNAVDWATGGKANETAKMAYNLGRWSKDGVLEFFRSLDKEQQGKILTLAKVSTGLSTVNKGLVKTLNAKDKEIASLQQELAAARKALRKEARTTTKQEDVIEAQEVALKERDATIQELFSKLDRVLALHTESEEENVELKGQLDVAERKLDTADQLIQVQKQMIDRVDTAATGVFQPDEEEQQAAKHLLDEIRQDETLVRDIKVIFGVDRKEMPKFTPSMQERLATRIQVWMRDQKQPYATEAKDWQSSVEESFTNLRSQVLYAHDYPNMGNFIHDYAKPLFDLMAKDRLQQKENFVQSLPTARKESQSVGPFVDYLLKGKENMKDSGLTNAQLNEHLKTWLKSEQKPADLQAHEWEKLVDKAFDQPQSQALKDYGFANPSKFIKQHRVQIQQQLTAKG